MRILTHLHSFITLPLFSSRVDALYPVEIENEELNSLLTTIKNQGEEIEKLQKELDKYKKKAAKKTAAE